MTKGTVVRLGVAGAFAATVGFSPVAGVVADTCNGGTSSSTTQPFTIANAGANVPCSQSQVQINSATSSNALGQTVTGSGNQVIQGTITNQTQSNSAAQGISSFNGDSGHKVVVGGRSFSANGSGGGSFVSLGVGGASNTGGGVLNP